MVNVISLYISSLPSSGSRDSLVTVRLCKESSVTGLRIRDASMAMRCASARLKPGAPQEYRGPSCGARWGSGPLEGSL
jgi:hypothetical protein